MPESTPHSSAKRKKKKRKKKEHRYRLNTVERKTITILFVDGMVLCIENHEEFIKNY